MNRVLCKTGKVKVGNSYKRVKLYKVKRTFIYYRKYRWVYLDSEGNEVE